MATILASQPPLVEATSDEPTWQLALRRAIRSRAELLSELGLASESDSDAAALHRAEEVFPLFVPREFVRRMRQGDPQDPLLLQVLSNVAELEHSTGDSPDPVGDLSSEVVPGLLKKYATRALFILSGACAVHCRYCFRREYPYATAPKNPNGWSRGIEYLSSDSSIDEVILSGGDPLMVPDESIGWLVDQLSEIPHLSRLRIHTRLPVVIPQRITPSLISILSRSRMAVYVVLHINHAQEIDQDLCEALAKLKSIGVTLLNQSVLLRGVNDTIAAQMALCRRLADRGVIPYYLHQLDRVQGAQHFEADISHGRELLDALRAQLPGYAVPKYVMEIAGDSSKRPL